MTVDHQILAHPLVFKWTLLPNPNKFSIVAPEILRTGERDGGEVNVTLTVDHKNVFSSSLSPSKRLHQIWKNFLRYRIHNYETNGQKDNPKT